MAQRSHVVEQFGLKSNFERLRHAGQIGRPRVLAPMKPAALPTILALACLALLACPLASANTAPFQIDDRSGAKQWTLYVGRETPVRLHVEVSGAFTDLTLDGPYECHDASLGTGAGNKVTGKATFDLNCGTVALGWYTVTMSLGHGLASGTVSSRDATILY
jgi:hypothetical protein